MARVRFIKHAQHCGFTLKEICELLTLQSSDSACCNDVRRLAIEKKLQLETTIRSMKAMSGALDILIADCPEQGRAAGWLEDLRLLARYQRGFDIAGGVVLVLAGVYMLNVYYLLVPELAGF